ncbi:MAG: SusC/RagA family TonB-linked outer membrane protein, partial [Cyclobacteriaceae bacterium]|nr:SusC/RagA family TonB-linked outer membrane protein [Cyclobacteriaceae bacterium]
GSQQGSITDVDGNYKVSVSEDATLKFSYIGYLDYEVQVGNQSVIDVVMETDVTQLSEVVVTAFSIEKDKKSLGYSVTQLGGEDFIKAREINMGDALQGKVAGVNVSNIGSGVAGSSRVIIRGNTSLSGNNEPLYVIDGVPMDNSQQGAAGMWGGRDWGDGLSSLNPDDIESISVLKGNTAAALYGSRASNGVVLITTKKGTTRKGIGVDFNSTYTAETFINNYDFQQEYGHGNRGEKPTTEAEGFDYGNSAWGGKLDGSQVYQFDGVQRPYSYAGDNFKNYYRTGNTFTNTLALTGGSDTQTFRFSFSDLRNTAISPSSGMNRQNFSLNTNSVWAEKLTLNAKILYSREDVQNRARLSDAPGNGNYTLVALPPSIAVQDLKGTTEKLGAQEDGTELQYNPGIYSQNPYWAAYEFKTTDVRNRVIGSALLRYDITDFLFIHGRIGMDWYTTRRTDMTPYGTAYQPLGSMSETQRTQSEINMEYMIGYDDTFGDIRVNAFFGGNSMRRDWENVGGSGSNFNVPFLHTLGNTANRSTIYDITESGINSLFGSAEISWKNMLFLNATARNDWFSTLPKDNNSILYPSIGASWVFSDAFSMPEFITIGKLRGSWAQVGGGANPYQLALNYGLVGQGHLGATLGRINQSSVPNSALIPLTSTEYEIGFDLGFFNNRLRLDYAYYNRKTEDDILNASIAQTSGYGSATVNVGQISNTGHEILLTGT